MSVLTANTKREVGKNAQSGNIMAAKVSPAVSRTLGVSSEYQSLLNERKYLHGCKHICWHIRRLQILYELLLDLELC